MKHSNFNQVCQNSVLNFTQDSGTSQTRIKLYQRNEKLNLLRRNMNQKFRLKIQHILLSFFNLPNTSHLIPIKLLPSNYNGSISSKMKKRTWAEKRIKNVVNSNRLLHPFQSLLHFTPSPLPSLKNFHNLFRL